jgi:hypothetical protein
MSVRALVATFEYQMFVQIVAKNDAIAFSAPPKRLPPELNEKISLPVYGPG